MQGHLPATVARARRLRSEMTWPALLVWQELRKRPAGMKFRRQHPVGRFVLDFYCVEARLAVEIEGIAHDMRDRPDRDAQRDTRLSDQGIRVLRIRARDVLADLEGAVPAIVDATNPLRRAVRATSPGGGEAVFEQLGQGMR